MPLSRAILLAGLLALVGCEKSANIAPFTSDGCSLFPDASAITRSDWCECCVEHDVAYWRGGTREVRELADRALAECVMQKTGNESLAKLMYNGVRVGGAPYFPNWYRWGYGWSFDRRYEPLTAEETAHTDSILQLERDRVAQTACNTPGTAPLLLRLEQDKNPGAPDLHHFDGDRGGFTTANTQ